MIDVTMNEPSDDRANPSRFSRRNSGTMPDDVIDRLVPRLVDELMAYAGGGEGEEGEEGGLFISAILKTRAKPARRMANYEVEGVMSRNYERGERRERGESKARAIVSIT